MNINKKNTKIRTKRPKPKVLIISRFFPEDYKGGGESVIHNIWKRARQHYDVRLVTGWVNNPKLLPQGTYAVDLRSKNRFVRYFKLYFAVKKYANKIKPDLIHSNAIEVPKLKFPTIVTSHHLGHMLGRIKESPIRRIRTKIQKIFLKKRYKQFKKVLAVSHSTKNDLIELGINPKKIKVIYNGIDINKFKPKCTKTKQEKNKFIILYLSRISREKGQHIAINAVKHLKQTLPKEQMQNIVLYIVGFVSDKKYLNQLKKMSKDLPVKILSNVPSIVDYYNKCDVFIFPTMMTEGFGLVSAEAFCCKKPVIASDYPAIREVVRQNGIMVPPGRSKPLADAIIKLYKNPKLRKKFAINGRKFVLQNFTWEIAFKKYKQVYDSILYKEPPQNHKSIHTK